MICRNITLTFKDDTLRPSSKMYLHKNDGDVQYTLTINGNPFTFNGGTNFVASAIIQRPDKQLIYLDLLQCEGGKVNLIFTKAYIDELEEVGTHLVQLSLHSSQAKSDRLTLPPFEIEVLPTIG